MNSDASHLDFDRFAAPGAFDDPVVVVRSAKTSPAGVFAALTDSTQASEWMDAPVLIDLQVGGRYEFLFDLDQPEGMQGSEGCQILAFVPAEMLAFTWNSPPSLAEVRGLLTFVVIQLSQVEDSTEIRLSHLGHGQGEVWERNREYFGQAWPMLLDRLVAYFD